ncbi:MAG: hypothetical protein MK135_17335, partial [Polyangiaceae bacterium]|nr:hypothetical protein [Polyangiaceae bacterium]
IEYLLSFTDPLPPKQESNQRSGSPAVWLHREVSEVSRALYLQWLRTTSNRALAAEWEKQWPSFQDHLALSMEGSLSKAPRLRCGESVPVIDETRF